MEVHVGPTLTVFSSSSLPCTAWCCSTGLWEKNWVQSNQWANSYVWKWWCLSLSGTSLCSKFWTYLKTYFYCFFLFFLTFLYTFVCVGEVCLQCLPFMCKIQCIRSCGICWQCLFCKLFQASCVHCFAGESGHYLRGTYMGLAKCGGCSDWLTGNFKTI